MGERNRNRNVVSVRAAVLAHPTAPRQNKKPRPNCRTHIDERAPTARVILRLRFIVCATSRMSHDEEYAKNRWNPVSTNSCRFRYSPRRKVTPHHLDRFLTRYCFCDSVLASLLASLRRVLWKGLASSALPSERTFHKNPFSA